MAEAAAKSWTSAQKHVVAAAYLGWMLDAFDFFLLVFVLSDVAKTFHIPVSPHPVALGASYAAAQGLIAKAAILLPFIFHRFIASLTGVDGLDMTIVLTVTLALRPVGAFLFGRLADRFGRRRVLMADVLMYSVLAVASAFAPTFTIFLLLRALFGVAMGGEWGIGASLAMESIPPASRGLVSGILQAGYPSGYLIASIAYAVLFPLVGWRWLFVAGVIPALLVLYIRRNVPESPAWATRTVKTASTFTILARHWKMAIYVVLLMTAFNFFSHGTQDLYPTFLKVNHHLDPHSIGLIAVTYNIGAILGGLCFGALSQRFGRRRTLITGALLSLPVIPLWAFAEGPVLLAASAFVMQFLVQGCWGVIPAHLNELSPPDARGTFPGTVYQLGNFLASINSSIQGVLAAIFGGAFAFGLAIIAGLAAISIAILAAVGGEAREIDMTKTD
ncbi:MAG TPA: MFS transporter [Rhizomicrobium sp.]|jgi:SHS family lactate transporter-like MFS transporter